MKSLLRSVLLLLWIIVCTSRRSGLNVNTKQPPPSRYQSNQPQLEQCLVGRVRNEAEVHQCLKAVFAAVDAGTVSLERLQSSADAVESVVLNSEPQMQYLLHTLRFGFLNSLKKVYKRKPPPDHVLERWEKDFSKDFSNSLPVSGSDGPHADLDQGFINFLQNSSPSLFLAADELVAFVQQSDAAKAFMSIWQYLSELDNWTTYWGKLLLLENRFCMPKLIVHAEYDFSTHSLLAGFELARLEEVFGISVADLDFIVDVGGGQTYGHVVSVATRLGFTGAAVVFDSPVRARLTDYLLRGTGEAVYSSTEVLEAIGSGVAVVDNAASLAAIVKRMRQRMATFKKRAAIFLPYSLEVLDPEAADVIYELAKLFGYHVVLTGDTNLWQDYKASAGSGITWHRFPLQSAPGVTVSLGSSIPPIESSSRALGYSTQSSVPYFGEFFKNLLEARGEPSSGGESSSEFAIGLLLFSLATSIRATNILEVGRFTGFSTLALGSALRFQTEIGWHDSNHLKQRPGINYKHIENKNTPRKLYSVEPYPTLQADSWIKRANLTDYVVKQDVPSRQARVDEFPVFDFMFIDGDHAYEQALWDMQTFFEYLRPGGLMVVHDYFGWFDGRGINNSPVMHAMETFLKEGAAVEHLLIDTNYPSAVVFRKLAPGADLGLGPAPGHTRAQGKGPVLKPKDQSGYPSSVKRDFGVEQEPRAPAAETPRRKRRSSPEGATASDMASDTQEAEKPRRRRRRSTEDTPAPAPAPAPTPAPQQPESDEGLSPRRRRRRRRLDADPSEAAPVSSQAPPPPPPPPVAQTEESATPRRRRRRQSPSSDEGDASAPPKATPPATQNDVLEGTSSRKRRQRRGASVDADSTNEAPKRTSSSDSAAALSSGPPGETPRQRKLRLKKEREEAAQKRTFDSLQDPNHRPMPKPNTRVKDPLAKREKRTTRKGVPINIFKSQPESTRVRAPRIKSSSDSDSDEADNSTDAPSDAEEVPPPPAPKSKSAGPTSANAPQPPKPTGLSFAIRAPASRTVPPQLPAGVRDVDCTCDLTWAKFEELLASTMKTVVAPRIFTNTKDKFQSHMSYVHMHNASHFDSLAVKLQDGRALEYHTTNTVLKMHSELLDIAHAFPAETEVERQEAWGKMLDVLVSEFHPRTQKPSLVPCCVPEKRRQARGSDPEDPVQTRLEAMLLRVARMELPMLWFWKETCELSASDFTAAIPGVLAAMSSPTPPAEVIAVVEELAGPLTYGQARRARGLVLDALAFKHSKPMCKCGELYWEESVLTNLKSDAVVIAALSTALPASLQPISMDEKGPLGYARDNTAKIEATVKGLNEKGMQLYDALLPKKLVVRLHEVMVKNPSMDTQTLLELGDVQKLVLDPTILSVVQGYFNAPARLTKIEHSDNPGYTMNWHQDKLHPQWLRIFMYMNDIDTNNQPHIYATTSLKHIDKLVEEHPVPYKMPHQSSDEVLVATVGKENIVEVCGQAGTIFFEDTRGMHRAKPHISGIRRQVLMISYTSSFYDSEDRMPFFSLANKGKFLPTFLEARNTYKYLFEAFSDSAQPPPGATRVQPSDLVCYPRAHDDTDPPCLPTPIPYVEHEPFGCSPRFEGDKRGVWCIETHHERAFWWFR